MDPLRVKVLKLTPLAAQCQGPSDYELEYAHRADMVPIPSSTRYRLGAILYKDTLLAGTHFFPKVHFWSPIMN